MAGGAPRRGDHGGETAVCFRCGSKAASPGRGRTTGCGSQARRTRGGGHRGSRPGAVGETPKTRGCAKMIQANDLWKKFGRHNALRGLSFTVPQGSAYALIGANGAGKTTTIKVLMNIIEPTRGSAAILGVD